MLVGHKTVESGTACGLVWLGVLPHLSPWNSYCEISYLGAIRFLTVRYAIKHTRSSFYIPSNKISPDMLQPQIRGTLDTIIDQMLTVIPREMSYLRDGGAKVLHVKNLEDYLLGFVHGAIMGSFNVVFSGIMKRQPNDEEQEEAQNIVFQRTSQLREAIFKRE
jgi:hypothetical protein